VEEGQEFTALSSDISRKAELRKMALATLWLWRIYENFLISNKTARFFVRSYLLFISTVPEIKIKCRKRIQMESDLHLKLLQTSRQKKDCQYFYSNKYNHNLNY
jgi:hypothetical protein